MKPYNLLLLLLCHTSLVSNADIHSENLVRGLPKAQASSFAIVVEGFFVQMQNILSKTFCHKIRVDELKVLTSGTYFKMKHTIATKMKTLRVLERERARLAQAHHLTGVYLSFFQKSFQRRSIVQYSKDTPSRSTIEF